MAGISEGREKGADVSRKKFCATYHRLRFEMHEANTLYFQRRRWRFIRQAKQRHQVRFAFFCRRFEQIMRGEEPLSATFGTFCSLQVYSYTTSAATCSHIVR